MAFAIALLAGCAAPTVAPSPTLAPAAQSGITLRVATTTSTYDTGLLTAILPVFEKQAGVKVDVVSVGTGQALKLGEDGNADIVLVHARAQEDAFMKAEHGIRREDVMYNDFVIVGPATDPAGIKGAKTAAEAFALIQSKQALFVSRGDKSGTHTKEIGIWKLAKLEPAGAWYQAVGQGMGAVLTMASEQNAYTLTDRGTYLARKKKGIALEVLVQGEKSLLNPYGVIVVNPAKNPAINAKLAGKFVDWLISIETQRLINDFGKAEFGESLFVADSALWRASK